MYFNVLLCAVMKLKLVRLAFLLFYI